MDETGGGDNMADLSQIPSAQPEKHNTRWDKLPNGDTNPR